MLVQIVEQVASCHELRDNVVAVVVLESLDELEDVGTVGAGHLLHDIELFKGLVVGLEAFLNKVLFDHFDCNLDVRELVLR